MCVSGSYFVRKDTLIMFSSARLFSFYWAGGYSVQVAIRGPLASLISISQMLQKAPEAEESEYESHTSWHVW